MACIYRHLKPDGEVFYIGIGKETSRAYVNKIGSWGRSKFWGYVTEKYPNYEVQVLKTDLSWEDACELEKILISWYGRRDLGTGTLVNQTSGGDGTPNRKFKTLSTEHRKSISNANKGRSTGPMSEETKIKLSIVQKGRKRIFSESHKANWIKAIHKPHTEESKQKMSLVKKGKTFSEEHKQKLSLCKLGKKVNNKTPESIAKFKETIRLKREQKSVLPEEKLAHEKINIKTTPLF